MTALTDDRTAVDNSSRLRSGLLLALASATSFALAGPLAGGLTQVGWSPGAAVTVRVLLAAAVLVVPALAVLRGRWRLVWHNAGLITAYGATAVAGTQLAFFNAVVHLEVGVALLIEYAAPVAVIGWLWLRHGQAPGRRTIAGAVVCVLGLLLVLDIFSGASVNLAGVLWALAAMVCVTTYFLLSAKDDTGLPPLVLAASGLLVGGLMLLAAGALGLVAMDWSVVPVGFADTVVPWWVPIVGLGVVTAALAYSTGIAAGRRLGSRLASFVANSEVVLAMLFAWLLLGQLPSLVQLFGGVLILGGVVLVKLEEG